MGGGENATTENATLKYAASYCKGGNCRTGKRGSDEVWKAKRNLTTWVAHLPCWN